MYGDRPSAWFLSQRKDSYCRDSSNEAAALRKRKGRGQRLASKGRPSERQRVTLSRIKTRPISSTAVLSAVLKALPAKQRLGHD